MIVPRHEQHWPTLLMPFRREEYVLPDRTPSSLRKYATIVQAQDVIAAMPDTNIDARYFVGTCFHESGGASNEWDTEIATASSPGGFMSVGLFQIGEEEARRYGFALTDMLDVAKSVMCMARLAKDNANAILSYAGYVRNDSKPDYTDPSGVTWANGGLRAYMAIAHNHGLGYVHKSIKTYGLDWAQYKVRNPHDHIVDHGYGEDCVTGGRWWSAEKKVD